MLTERDLRELLDYQPGSPVLSVYLNTALSDGSADAYKLHLRTMLKDVTLTDDVQIIERYFATEYNGSGRSTIIFSCAAHDFLRVFTLAVPVRNRIRVTDHPHVKPLADLLDAYGGYGVALVDKQGARLFSFHLGELTEQEGVLGEDVRHAKRGAASSVPGRRGGVGGKSRHADETTERNMKESAEFAASFFGENNVRRVLLGGTEDNIAQFRNHLPKTWQSLVVGQFGVSMNASHNEVLERAMEVGHKAERKREAALVETMITNAAKKHGGVIHPNPTLQAINDGRVQTLFIREGFRLPGHRCTGCGFVTITKAPVCALCGQKYEDIPDVIEMAVFKTMQQGGEVEVLHDDALTEKFGNIGALLRY